jgi:KDO2-lipid IV(A) lauroyltransferase
MLAARPPAPWTKRLRRALRVGALLAALPLLSRLPGWLRAPLAGLVGTVAYCVVGRERRLALAHLAIAFPGWTERCRRACARASFVSLARSALEVAAADRLQPRLRELVPLTEEDRALLAAAHAEGRGVLFASCHLGNWELLARRIALEGYACGTVAREAQDPRLSALLERSRAGAGVATLWRGSPGLARHLLRILRGGGFLGLLIDQDTDVQGCFVPFFGRLAHTPRAIGDLAARTGAPVLVGTTHREGELHRVTLRRITIPISDDRAEVSLQVNLLATRAIEDQVRAWPEQWVWMHRRWQRRPDGEPRIESTG